MLLKTVVSLTLCAGGLAMAAGSVESNSFLTRSFFPPNAKKAVPPIFSLLSNRAQKKAVCAVPLREAKARPTGDKLSIPTGRTDFDAIRVPPPVPVCKNW